MARQRRRLIRWRIFAAVLVCAGSAISAKAWHDTMADPVVHTTELELPMLPEGSGPLDILLISDIHVAGPDMKPERLERIVAQINALKPDLVAIAGDLVSEKGLASHIYPPEQVVAPLGKLDAPLGVYVVPGNHDHWYDLEGIARELRRHGITLLENQAAQAGPLVIGGLDDDYTGKSDIPATVAAMSKLHGARVLLSHSPDPFPNVPASVPLMLAGHTHCGQIAYPWGGAPATMSDYGDKYACGRVDEDGKTLIVGPGLGTSLIPVRLFTRPTLWLIKVKPPKP